MNFQSILYRYGYWNLKPIVLIMREIFAAARQASNQPTII